MKIIYGGIELASSQPKNPHLHEIAQVLDRMLTAILVHSLATVAWSIGLCSTSGNVQRSYVSAYVTRPSFTYAKLAVKDDTFILGKICTGIERINPINLFTYIVKAMNSVCSVYAFHSSLIV